MSSPKRDRVLKGVHMRESLVSPGSDEAIRQEAPTEQHHTAKPRHPRCTDAKMRMCPHGGVIYEILNGKEKRTGHVRCLDCGAIIEDRCFQDERAHLPDSVP